jgi:hypothetical protein
MKKIVSILCVAGLIATCASAQKSNNASFKYGIKAGVNFASNKITSSAITQSGSLTGLTAGVYGTFALSESFGIQPELLYSEMGGKFSSENINIKLNYLSIPVLAKYSFGTSGFSALAGPQIGLLLSAKEGSTDVKSYFNSTDFSAVIGAEYALTKMFNVSARYQAGLSNIAKTTSGGFGSGDKSTNSALTVTVGYTF